MQKPSVVLRSAPGHLEREDAALRTHEGLLQAFRQKFPDINSRLLFIDPNGWEVRRGTLEFRVCYQPLVKGTPFWVGDIEVQNDGSVRFPSGIERMKDAISDAIGGCIREEVHDAVIAHTKGWIRCLL